MFWMLYSFFWVIPQHLNFMCRRFRTLCLIHLLRRCLYCLWRHSVLKRRHVKFKHQGITPKKEYNRNSPLIMETYSRMKNVCVLSHIMLTNSRKSVCFHFLCNCFQVWTIVSHKAANPKHQHKRIYVETQWHSYVQFTANVVAQCIYLC